MVTIFHCGQFGVHFGNSVLDNSNWDKISHSLTKKNISKSATLFGTKKKNCEPNPLIQTLVYRSNIYYPKNYHGGNSKINGSTLHLEVWTRYFRHRYS